MTEKMVTQKKVQMSESAVVNLVLALSGGCMDAYSYLYRGEVFANAQTGNMLLFGVNAAEKSCFYLLYAGSHSRRMTWPTC